MGKEPLDVADKAKVKKRIRDAKNKKKSLSYEEFEEVGLILFMRSCQIFDFQHNLA